MRPFVKWAGGKTQLLSCIIERMPHDYNCYYEPFVGSGALLFSLAPKKALINDINSELVNVYTVIRDRIDELVVFLELVDGNHQGIVKQYYYEQRERYNKKIAAKEYDVEMAALFIYLNKHCFNGLYRVNNKGLFNVPFNGKKTGNSFDKGNLREISNYLKDVTIMNEDFEKAVSATKKGDFVFFDSPYAPLSDTSFESYTKNGFGYDEHLRLSNLYKELNKKGVYCMLTNHNTQLINDLYCDFRIEVVPVKRLINSDSKNRIGEETIITNY